jgi:GcrA cell cycle regulator
MRGQSWTLERIALLRKLWGEGETAVTIADRLGGMSRSAVLGKIFRLRLPVADVTAAAQSKPAALTNRADAAASPARRRRSGVRKKQAEAAPTKTIQRKTLLELTNNTCRWPHGRPGTDRFFFCGAPEADLAKGIPYCARHMRRAYPAFASPSFASPSAGAATPSRRANAPSSPQNRVDLRSLLLTPRTL